MAVPDLTPQEDKSCIENIENNFTPQEDKSCIENIENNFICGKVYNYISIYFFRYRHTEDTETLEVPSWLWL